MRKFLLRKSNDSTLKQSLIKSNEFDTQTLLENNKCMEYDAI
jgi:hypothetical protein